jgi:hypothetical protein
MKNIRSSFLKREARFGLYIFGASVILAGRTGLLNRPTAAVLVLITFAALYGLRQFVKMRYTDYVFEPMRPDDLPRDTYNVFNNYTPQFMQLGGGLVGDYRLAYSPRPVFIRYFLPPDDRVKAQVSDWDGKFTPSFTSYFTDGRLIETAIMSPPGNKVSDESKLWFFKVSPCPITELYQRHIETINAYQESHQATALKITPAILAELAQYGHRLVWWEKGILPSNIPEPVLPESDLVPLRPAATLTT